VKENRQPEIGRALKHLERFRSQGIEILVVRPQLDPAQSEILRRPLDLIQRVGIERVHGEKSDELFRVGVHEGSRIVIRVPGWVDQRVIVRLTLAWIGRDVENDRAVNVFQRLQVLVPGVGGRSALIGAPQPAHTGVFVLRRRFPPRCVIVNVDDRHAPPSPVLFAH